MLFTKNDEQFHIIEQLPLNQMENQWMSVSLDWFKENVTGKHYV